MFKIKLAEIISTFFYIGKIKYCPGTFGSMAAFPIVLAVVYFTFLHNLFPLFLPTANVFLSISFNLMIIWLVIFILGIYFSDIHASYVGQFDPKEIVIDEVAGQLLTFALIIPSILVIIGSGRTFIVPTAWQGKVMAGLYIFMPFLLFRLFDIVKPWPINWLDQNVKGGVGIMLDDFVAALFATVIYYAIILIIIDRFGKPFQQNFIA